MSTQILLLEADSRHQVVQALELERCKLQMTTHNAYHLLVFVAIGIGILLKYLIWNIVSTLNVADYAASIQVVCTA